ncbi:MAG TPA: hypothetical protein O0X39_03545 [Methanocorpusculum sp.]|nr:hypothetical protein [Methanocorpusculum sp.]
MTETCSETNMNERSIKENPHYTMKQLTLKIQKWFCGTIRTGRTCYLKSKEITPILGITSKSAGLCLASLSEEENQPFTITKWGFSPSITWKITRKETWTEENISTYLSILEKEAEINENERKKSETSETYTAMRKTINPLNTPRPGTTPAAETTIRV